jgi:hypothetical protein
MISSALEKSAKPVTAILKATAKKEWKEDEKTLAKLCGLR